MTSEERDQLVEDIKKVNSLRKGIVEMAERSADFDIGAAWEDVESLEASINERIARGRLKE